MKFISDAKCVDNFIKEWVEYPFLAMPANANSIANAQCEQTLRRGSFALHKQMRSWSAKPLQKCVPELFTERDRMNLCI